MRSLRNITTLLLVGVLLAFGTNQIPVGANIPHITVASLSFAASALELSDAAPKRRSSRSSNAAQAINDADEALLHCAHCVSPEVLVKVASDCCNAAGSGKSGKCGECPAQQCGGCCGNGYTSLFLSSDAYSITFPSKSLAYSPEDWAATQRAHRPLLQPPRCS